MCGFAGFVQLGDNAGSLATIGRMSSAIAHRGPDDEGYVAIDNQGQLRVYSGEHSSSFVKSKFERLPNDPSRKIRLAFAHRRFSIVDLSPSGHQPFFDREGKYVVVFNGEIYNYIELRDELAKKGVVFSTTTDTEVLLEAYKHWGTEAFPRLNGFWALAIYNLETKQLVFSRDRLGKKPLYWTKRNGCIYFASEIKSLLQAEDVSAAKKVDEESLFHWMVYGKKDVDNRTFFDSVFTLPAASWAVVDDDFPTKIHRYWTIPTQRLPEREISVNDACKQLTALLESAVDLRLRADVPVAFELSGGMDSSCLSAIASRNRKNLSAYTVSFANKGADELDFAKSIARNFNLDHHVIDSPPENVWTEIIQFSILEEEPYHAPNLMSNQWIWRKMRQDGVKVSINGAAGDELFGGYPHYYKTIQNEHLSNLRFKNYLSNAVKYTQSSNKVKNLLQPLYFRVKSGLKLYDLPPGYFRYSEKRPLETSSKLSGVLLDDMTNQLMPYWLRSGDKSSMGIPLEVRAPMLDYRMVEFAFQLPVSFLIRDGWHKWILRKSFEGILPNDVLWRKTKMGFPFPYEAFYCKSKPLIHKIIDGSQNPYVDKTQKALYDTNWKVISFLIWYELFINQNQDLIDQVTEFSRQHSGTRVSSAFEPSFYETCNAIYR